jgi:hypothetical protein
MTPHTPYTFRREVGRALRVPARRPSGHWGRRRPSARRRPVRDRGARTPTSSGELVLPPLQPSPTPPRAPRPPIAPYQPLMDARSPLLELRSRRRPRPRADPPHVRARAAAQHLRRAPPCTTAARPCPPPHARIARAWCGLRSRHSLPQPAVTLSSTRTLALALRAGVAAARTEVSGRRQPLLT